MAQVAPVDAYAMTRADYDALNLTRPYTDKPIGHFTQGKRDVDAEHSALFRDTTPDRAGWKAPRRTKPPTRAARNPT